MPPAPSAGLVVVGVAIAIDDVTAPQVRLGKVEEHDDASRACCVLVGESRHLQVCGGNSSSVISGKGVKCPRPYFS